VSHFLLKRGYFWSHRLDAFCFARSSGHPDYVHIGENVAKAIGSNASAGVRDASVVVIGQGNVALDCARILAKGGTGLYDTDLAAHAVPVLGDGVARVYVVGRRGHVQGAFTIKELRELVNLEKEGYGATFHVDAGELAMGMTEASKEELSAPGGRPRKRMDKLLTDTSKTGTCLFDSSSQHSSFFHFLCLGVPLAPILFSDAVHNDSAKKKVYLHFLLNPVKFELDESDQSSSSKKLGAVVCERTKLEGPAGKQRAVGTGEYRTIPAQLALVSIGYKGVLLPGTEPWFDADRGVLRNENGRVDPPAARSSGGGGGRRLAGLYASGWLKRGPSGIIGTNIPDAKDTVATIVEDLVREGRGGPNDEESSGKYRNLRELLDSRKVRFVDWDGYRRLDSYEKQWNRSSGGGGSGSDHDDHGAATTKPREKVVDRQKQLDIALAVAVAADSVGEE